MSEWSELINEQIMDAPLRFDKPVKRRSMRGMKRELTRVVGRHNRWSDMVLTNKARELLDEIHRGTLTFSKASGWYIFKRLREESFSQRIFPVRRKWTK